jgi:hypothetical protein
MPKLQPPKVLRLRGAAIVGAGLVLSLAGREGMSARSPGEAIAEPAARRIVAPAAGRELVGWSYSIAPRSDGGFLVAWLDLEPDERRGEVRLQGFDASLQPRGAPLIIGKAEGCQGRPAVAAFADGAAVLWCAGPGAKRLFLRLPGIGPPSDAEVEITSGAANSFEPRALAASGDRLLAVWTAREPFGQIQTQFFDRQGAAVGERATLGSAPQATGANPAAACGGRHCLVTWGDDEDIWVQALAEDGTFAGPRLRVNDGVHAFRSHPFVAMDGTGGAVLVWSERPPGGIAAVAGRRFLPNGSPAGPPFAVSSYIWPLTYAAVGPTVAGGAGGPLLFVWEGSDSEGQVRGTFGRWFDARRSLPVEEEFLLAPAGELAGSVSALASERLLAAWSDPKPLDSRGVWATTIDLGELASAPRTVMEAVCAGEQLQATARHLSLQQRFAGFTLFDRTDGTWTGTAYEAAAAESGARQRGGGAGTAGKDPGTLASHWFTLDADHRAQATDPPEAYPGATWAPVHLGPGPHADAAGPIAAPVAWEPIAATVRATSAPPSADPAPPPTCPTPPPSEWDETRMAWLANHLRPLGDAQATALTIHRGTGVDTFLVELYPEDPSDPALLPPAAAVAPAGASAAAAPPQDRQSPDRRVLGPRQDHLTVETRLFCSHSGEPAKLRMRLLPRCTGAGDNKPCSTFRGSYALVWNPELTRPTGRPVKVWSGSPGRDEAWVDLAPTAGGAADRPELGALAAVCPPPQAGARR